MLSRSRSIIGAIAVFGIVFSLGMMFVPMKTSAASAPITIVGYVRDNAGNPLSGAQVTVTVRYETTLAVRATQTTSTGSDGLYQTDFLETEYDIGNRVDVSSVYNSVPSDGNSTFVTGGDVDQGYAWLNDSFSYEIPEFGSIGGVVLGAFSIGIIAIVILGKKRK